MQAYRGKAQADYSPTSPGDHTPSHESVYSAQHDQKAGGYSPTQSGGSPGSPGDRSPGAPPGAVRRAKRPPFKGQAEIAGDTTTLTVNPSSPHRRPYRPKASKPTHMVSSELNLIDSPTEPRHAGDTSTAMGGTSKRRSTDKASSDKLRSSDKLSEKPTSERQTDEDTGTGDGTGDKDSTEAFRYAVPQLLFGKNWEKPFPLKPNRWFLVGRDQATSHLWLYNSGISRNHCKLRYSQGQKYVEFHDSSTHGTLINGNRIKDQSCKLWGGDNIKILSKDQEYNFKIDMGLIGKDTERDTHTDTDGIIHQNPEMERRIDLKKEVAHLDKQLEEKGRQAFLLEKEWYRLLVERQKEQEEIARSEAECLRLQQECKVMQDALDKSSEEWMQKVKAVMEGSTEKHASMREKIHEQMEQLSKLRALSEELKRKLNPEAYGTMQVTELPGSPSDTERPDQMEDARTVRTAQALESVEGDSDDEKGLNELLSRNRIRAIKAEAEDEKKDVKVPLEPTAEKKKEKDGSSSSSSSEDEISAAASTPVSSASSLSDSDEEDGEQAAKKQRTA